MKKHMWKIVAVVLMLTGMLIYVYTLDETVRPLPEGDQNSSSPPADAPLTDKPH